MRQSSILDINLKFIQQIYIFSNQVRHYTSHCRYSNIQAPFYLAEMRTKTNKHKILLKDDDMVMQSHVVSFLVVRQSMRQPAIQERQVCQGHDGRQLIPWLAVSKAETEWGRALQRKAISPQQLGSKKTLENTVPFRPCMQRRTSAEKPSSPKRVLSCKPLNILIS